MTNVNAHDVDVAAIAPEALAAFEEAMASARDAVDPLLYGLARARMAMLLRIDPPTSDTPIAAGKHGALATWPTSPVFTTTDRACLDLAEQFVLDVSAVSDRQRDTLTAALGDDTASFVQGLYVADFELRLRGAFRQLFGVDPLTVDPPPTSVALWPALEAMLTAIARLSAVDPMTTELVRLRGARTHNCRFCRSLRNVRAVDGGGDETTFDKIDDYERSDLDDRHKVALRLTDAIIWQPGAFPDGLVDQVHALFPAQQAVEIVLDVARNALNKYAVTMGIDGEGVGDELAYYDTDADGELVYGLTPGR
jgi:alkylhydroperoxidase family enzyme